MTVKTLQKLPFGPSLVGASLLTVLCVNTSFAQQSITVSDALAACMAVTDSAQRYACYDRVETSLPAISGSIEEVRGESTAAPVVNLIPDTSPNPSLSNTRPVLTDETELVSQALDAEQQDIDNFGSTSVRLSENESGDQVLTDRIASLRERLPNQWSITLEGGQIWNQINSKSFRLRKGMEVSVAPSPFGQDFRLSSSAINGFIQVRRVQ